MSRGFLGWKPILGFAWCLLREHGRRVLVLSLILFPLLCSAILLLPAVDAAARLTLLKSSLLSLATLLAIFLGVLLSATALPRDEAQRFTYTLLTKPVRRRDLVIGKALGNALVTGIMVSVAALVTFLFLSGASYFSAPEQLPHPLAVRSMVLASRRSSPDRARSAEVALGAATLAGVERLVPEFEALFQGESMSWRFVELERARLGAEPQFLLTGRLFEKSIAINRVWVAGASASSALGSVGAAVAPQVRARGQTVFLRARFQCADRVATRDVFLKAQKPIILPIPRSILPEQGSATLDITVTNNDPAMVVAFDARRDAAGDERYGLGIISARHSFALNLFMAFLLLWLRVALLIAFATAASTCLSAWTAAFVTIFFAILGSSVPFMMDFGAKLAEPRVAHDHVGPEHPEEEEVIEPSIFDKVSAATMTAAAAIVPDLSRFDVSPLILKGQRIPWRLLFRQSGVTLAAACLCLFVGSLIFYRRDFG